MTKEAIRKREYRANKESKEQADRRRAKDNAATKERNDKQSYDQKKARNEANKLNMRANRDAKKLVLAEFQTIQTAPRALKTRNYNLSRGHPSHESSDDDSPSEYEKLRLRNIQENKQKFRELFGISGPFPTQNQKRSLSVSNPNSESSDEEITPTVKPSRRQPKRQCKTFSNDVLESSDSSFEAYVDDLVEASTAEMEVDPSVIVTPIINTIINSVFGSKPRKQNIGRKTKNAKRMALSRYVLINIKVIYSHIMITTFIFIQ